jgi:peptidoglycan hydrolase-like protein with peptidoglycan-binding domain
MNLASALSLITTVITELPKITQVINDVSGIVTGTKPANHPNTGKSSGSENQTVMAIQRALNKHLNLQPPLVVDGLWGQKTDAAVHQALRALGDE